jgi:hypothetical protein
MNDTTGAVRGLRAGTVADEALGVAVSECRVRTSVALDRA